jgi:N-ethylmaleimide reductase
MEPNEEDLKTGSVQIEHTTAALRPGFPGVMISNGGYDKAKAEAALAAGTADLASFGLPFIANPDPTGAISKRYAAQHARPGDVLR